MRSFYGFPIQHFEFCQEVLREITSTTTEFAINIGETYRSAPSVSGLCALGFNVSSPEMHAIHAKLTRNFEHILEAMRSKSTTMTRGTPSHIRRGLWWTSSVTFKPRACVIRVPEDKSEVILKDLKAQRSRGTWEATVVSLRAAWSPKKEYWLSADYVDKFIEFPLQKRVA